MPYVAFRAPSLILCFLVPRVQKQSTMRGLLALCLNVGPGWVHVFAAKKKNLDFLLFCDFVAEIYKKKKKRNGITFKRSGFDKID